LWFSKAITKQLAIFPIAGILLGQKPGEGPFREITLTLPAP
jgi:hypothetical protein